MIKKYAKMKAELTHSYGLIWGVSSSDMKKGVRYEVEYIDFIECNEAPREAGEVHKFAVSWADTGWSPSNVSLGTMTTFLVYPDKTVEDFLAYKRSAIYGLSYNPDGAMLLWWTQTNGYNISEEWKPAIQEVNNYWHELFKKVRSIITLEPEKYTISGIYYASYLNRYGQKIWVDLGQVYVYALDLQFLEYVGIPSDAKAIYIGQTYNGVPGSSTPFVKFDALPLFYKLKNWTRQGGNLVIAHSFYKHVLANK